MAINWTVGSGGTYADWRAAILALPASFADDYVITQISAFTQSQGISSGSYGKSINLNGYSLRFTSNSPHQGVFNDGHVGSYSNAGAGNMLGFYVNGGSGSIEIDSLCFKKTVANRAGDELISVELAAASTASFKVHDCMMDAETFVVSGFLGRVQNASASGEVWNITYKSDGSSSSQDGIAAIRTNGSFVVENCTVHGATDGFDALNTVVTINNCCAFDCSSNGFFRHVNATGNNNASEDGTAADGNWASGADNETAIVPATEFESLTITDSDYVKVTDDGVCGTGGTAPTISDNTAGIRGDARSSSIGADELEIPVPPPPPPPPPPITSVFFTYGTTVLELRPPEFRDRREVQRVQARSRTHDDELIVGDRSLTIIRLVLSWIALTDTERESIEDFFGVGEVNASENEFTYTDFSGVEYTVKLLDEVMPYRNYFTNLWQIDMTLEVVTPESGS